MNAISADDTRSDLSRVFRNGGFTVLEARNATEALCAMAAQRPDVAVIDLNLPGIGGRELCERLKADPSTARIAVIHFSPTALDGPQRAQSLDSGATACLVHPVDPAELLATVRCALRAFLTEKECATLLSELESRADELEAMEWLLEQDGMARKNARKQLQDKATRLEQAYRAGKMWSWHIDPATRMLIREVGFGSQFDDISEMPLATWYERLHDEDREHVREVLESAIAGRSDYKAEFRLLWSNGEYRWVYARGNLVDGPNGRVLIGVAMDHTERRRNEEALRDSEARFRALTEHIPQLVWTCDAEGKCDYLSDSWFRYTGTTADQDFGFGWLTAVHPDDRERTLQTWVASVAAGSVFEAEYRLRNAAGDYEWHLARGVRLESVAGKGRWFGTSTNIEDLKRTQEVLMRSEKLASVGRMAATIAHEINNPLEAIMNILYLASTDPSLSPDVRSKLRLADRELERVAHITRQTLGFARGAGTVVVTDLGALVNDVVELYRPRLKNKNIHVEKRFQSCMVQAVPGEMRQVVSNLIANSIDAVSSGGHLALRIAPVQTPDGRYSVRLTIADDGSGIAREHARKVFEPFFTTKESVGTGLGLWVTREIVRKHSGSIRVRSRVGQGTVISICLPEAVMAAACSAD